MPRKTLIIFEMRAEAEGRGHQRKIYRDENGNKEEKDAPRQGCAAGVARDRAAHPCNNILVPSQSISTLLNIETACER